MIKIRLARHGKKNKVFYRIVAQDIQKKRDGAPLAVIGTWNPLKNEKVIDKDELKIWLAKGAITTKAVKVLLEK